MSSCQFTLPPSFFDKRVLMLGEVTKESASKLASDILRLQTLSDDGITLLIQSTGGDTFAALNLCDLMAHLVRAPIRGVVVGNCFSAATFVLLYCDERWATPHSRFLMHSSRISGLSLSIDQTTEENLQELLKETRVTSGVVNAMYMEKLGKTLEEVERLTRRGDQEFNEFMTAEEALHAGLIQTVVTSKLDL